MKWCVLIIVILWLARMLPRSTFVIYIIEVVSIFILFVRLGKNE